MLTVTNVEVRAGARLLLSPVSFPVNPGDTIGLVGRNGAGKTTTIHMATGLLRPSAGRIRVLGHDVGEEPLLFAEWIARGHEQEHAKRGVEANHHRLIVRVPNVPGPAGRPEHHERIQSQARQASQD